MRRWRTVILSVAVEEMAHLALVSNIACTLGVRPHFGRQNFPVAPAYHPAAITVALAPFDLDTLDHFIFLERPNDLEEQNGGFLTFVRVSSLERRGTWARCYRMRNVSRDGWMGLRRSSATVQVSRLRPALRMCHRSKSWRHRSWSQAPIPLRQVVVSRWQTAAT